jgi:hypothetical protein
LADFGHTTLAMGKPGIIPSFLGTHLRGKSRVRASALALVGSFSPEGEKVPAGRMRGVFACLRSRRFDRSPSGLAG